MNTISYTSARNNLAKTMQKVCDDHSPVIITRKGEDQAVVMMSMEEYSALQETAYLLRNTANARHLMDSIEAMDGGKGTSREIIE